MTRIEKQMSTRSALVGFVQIGMIIVKTLKSQNIETHYVNRHSEDQGIVHDLAPSLTLLES